MEGTVFDHGPVKRGTGARLGRWGNGATAADKRNYSSRWTFVIPHHSTLRVSARRPAKVVRACRIEPARDLLQTAAPHPRATFCVSLCPPKSVEHQPWVPLAKNPWVLTYFFHYRCFLRRPACLTLVAHDIRLYLLEYLFDHYYLGTASITRHQNNLSTSLHPFASQPVRPRHLQQSRPPPGVQINIHLERHTTSLPSTSK